MSKKTTATDKVQMECEATSPQMVPGVGEIPPGGTFFVDEKRAKELEKGLFKRAKGGK